MAPPAGGAAAAANPSSPAVLLAVQAAVRPLGAGHDTEAQLRRLQLSADPERPGRFRLGLLGTGPGAVSLEWPLESICYTVRGPNQHELQPPPGGPGTFSVHFLNSQEAQQWAALVRDATAEGQNGNGSQAPAPEMCPLSPPCSSVAQISQATQPEVDLPQSSGNLKKEELATRLAQAIADGDEKEAAHVAAILAQHHVALNVQLMEAWFPPGCKSQLKMPHLFCLLHHLPMSHCRSTHTAPLQPSRKRCSQSSVSRQLCSAGSLGGAYVCLNEALLPMGSRKMGTLLFSTCFQPPEKLQDIALNIPRWMGNQDACFLSHWSSLTPSSQPVPVSPIPLSLAGLALPAPSSMPQTALAVRCVAPKGPVLGIPLLRPPPRRHQRLQRQWPSCHRPKSLYHHHSNVAGDLCLLGTEMHCFFVCLFFRDKVSLWFWSLSWN